MHEGGADLLDVPARTENPVAAKAGDLVRPLLPEPVAPAAVEVAPEPGTELRTQVFRGPLVGQCQRNCARVPDPHTVLRLPQLRGHHPR